MGRSFTTHLAGRRKAANDSGKLSKSCWGPQRSVDALGRSPFRRGPLRRDNEEPDKVKPPPALTPHTIEVVEEVVPTRKEEPQLQPAVEASEEEKPGMYASSCPSVSMDANIAGLGLEHIADPPVRGGRIAHYMSNWQKVTQDPHLLAIVRGMQIDWLQLPKQMQEMHCPRFSETKSKQVTVEVQKLLEKGAIEPSVQTDNQFVSHIFLAPKKDGSNRPVINLKKVNGHVKYQHFKMEGIPNVVDLLQPNDFMVKLDLKDAYFGIKMSENDREYLKFRWQNQLYRFRVAPFGLGSVPRVFTKLLKPIVALLRRSGIRCVIFLDDLILLNQDPETLRKQLNIATWLLQNLGFLINWEKSVTNPTQFLEYLGFNIDSVKMTMSLPERKLQDLQERCQMLLRKGETTARNLAKILGKMTAALRAILPAPLQYRHLQRLKSRALKIGGQSYESIIVLTPECKAELQWWIESVPLWNGRSVMKPSPDLAIKMATDASQAGWGAHCNGVTTQGLWTADERKLHINALEMKAVVFAVKSFTKNRENVSIHLQVDNTTTVSYVNKMGGTKSLDMIQISKELWEYCLGKQIMITAEHLPGRLNTIADRESRMYQDSSNWKLDTKVFQSILKMLGTVELDLFADRMNTQTRKFISWKPDPEAWATDAFTVPWTGIAAYAFPPFCLIGRCLSKIRQDQATVILVTPTWQTQPWYPELMAMTIADPILLPPMANLLTSPAGQPHPLENQNLALAAWKVSGDVTLQQKFQRKLEIYSETHVGKAQNPLTRPPGENGLVGVIGNRLIRFKQLWST